MTSRVIHFEIHAEAPEKMAEFYKQMFGWEIKEWEMPGVKLENRFWSVLTAPIDSKEPGINGGMVVRKGDKPKGEEAVSAFICTIGVSSVDESLKKAMELGGSVALPKMPVAGMAWLAYCKDIEGNIFGIFQEDKTAK